MGERKGTNKYYPPDFDPRIHRSLDAYHGTHALRERAKKVKQGIIVIRFEMPYNIWCGGCGRPVAMGVRYNAEKKKVGMYYSTPIYEFNMKCHLCDQRYLIRTDPAKYDYVIVSGARRKEQRWDPTDTRQIVPEDGDTKRRMATDAMFRLEHGKADETRSSEETPRLAALVADADDRGADDVRLNRLVRAGLRTERHQLAAAKQADADLLARHSLTDGCVGLLPESPADALGAKVLRLSSSVVPGAVAASSSTAAAAAASSSKDCAAFGSVSPAEPDELRRRTGKSRQLLGVLVAKSATSSTVASMTTSDSATSPTVASMTTSESSTSPTESSATVSASCSATASAASSTVSATSPAESATSLDQSAVDDEEDGDASGDGLGFGVGLVQYSASPSPASSSDASNDEIVGSGIQT